MTNYCRPGFLPGTVTRSDQTEPNVEGAKLIYGKGMTCSQPLEIKVVWVPFSKESPPKGKHGDKKYIFLLVDKVPIVLAYWGEEFIPTKGMTHWFPIPEVIDGVD